MSLAAIREALLRQFAWPGWAAAAAQAASDLPAALDVEAIRRASAGRRLAVTFLTGSYGPIGRLWLRAMQRHEGWLPVVVAGDAAACEAVEREGGASFLVRLPAPPAGAGQLSRSGFTLEGLRMIALKFPVALALVRAGLDTVVSDADALWLQDPAADLAGADVAFQRVLYFPAQVAALWGFAACTGFVSLRATLAVAALLERCVAEQRAIFDDQLAFNLALLAGDPVWRMPAAAEPFGLQPAFIRHASRALGGADATSGLTLRALPHDRFWRHDFVPARLGEMAICHPNSPKEAAGKLAVFRGLGLA